MNANDKILAREVIAEKTPDGKTTLRIFVNAPKSGGKKVHPVSLLSRRDRSDRWHRPVIPVRPAQGAAPDLQAKAFGRGYLEDECSKAVGEMYKSGTYLWAVIEQEH